MKRKISISLLLIATLLFSLLVFTACKNNNDENGAKQVPVYQGMTITKSNSVLSLASYRMSGITLLSANNENNGDNGNHYGHYKGDHTDRNDTIDEDNPYLDNNANENIEEEIKSSLNVIGSPDEIYYANPNEDIYINIHIDNPDSFEIMSFTINGKKYSNYMFEEGSDMETIVLKYNVGDATGIVEYTIDAIKYIDGTEIKDVIIDGNKTVMAGIRTENQVAANVTDVDIDTSVLSFNVNIKDNNSLVEFSKGTLKAVLYDGSYHPVDSNEMAFKTAAKIAYKNGMAQANPVILEPIGELKVYMPDANLGDIMGDITKRRGRVLGMGAADEPKMQELVAEVPMAEMGDFSTTLRSVTAGRGYFTLEFARYEDAPSMVAQKVIEEAKKDMED